MVFGQDGEGDGGHHKKHDKHQQHEQHDDSHKSAAGKLLSEAWGHIGKAVHDVAHSNAAREVEHTASDALHNRGTAGKVANVAKEVGVHHFLSATPIGAALQIGQLATGHKPEAVKLAEKVTGHHIDVPNLFGEAGAELGKHHPEHVTSKHHERAEHAHKAAKQ